MTGPYLVGVDIGTLGSKGVITDLDGRILAEAFREHGVIHPQPGWAEHDAERDWWGDFVHIARALMAQSRVAPREIAAINVSGLVPDLLATDDKGVPLRNAILYSDNRAVKEIEYVNEQTGAQLTSEEITPKILWLKNHEPDILSRARMFFNAHSYIVYRLTGVYGVDTSTARGFGAIYSMAETRWLDDVCQQLGVPRAILPPLYAPPQVMGEVTSAAAKETDLAAGIPVLAGSGDTFFSILGAGIVSAGDAMIYYGTAGLVHVVHRDLDDLFSGVNVPRSRAVSGIAYMLTSGELVRWFRDQFGSAEQAEAEASGVSAYQLLDKAAESIPPGSDGLVVLPYFLGQRSPQFNPLACGVFFGLTMSHTREHLYRAILESFGYGCLHGLEERLPKWRSEVKRVVATGGGARSPVWRQIVSDIVGVRQEYVARADSPLGGAYFAGFGVGLFKDLRGIRDRWLEVNEVTEPNPARQPAYRPMYDIYCGLHPALRKSFQALSEAVGGREPQ